MIADRALISIGVFVIFISANTLVGLSKRNNKYLMLTFYSAAICMIFITVFAVGAMTFNQNILEWVDEHWEIIQQKEERNMEDFKNHVNSEIVSLGAFSLTIDFTLLLSIISITKIIGLRRVMILLWPLSNLMFIVMSSAIIIISLFLWSHESYTPTLPIWTNPTLISIAGFVSVLGILGYSGNATKHSVLLLIYIVLLAISSLVFLMSGVGLLLIAGNVHEIIKDDWQEIDIAMRNAGYQVNEVTFEGFVEENMKFAGLFTIVFCCFMQLGLIPAIYLKVKHLRY